MNVESLGRGWQRRSGGADDRRVQGEGRGRAQGHLRRGPGTYAACLAELCRSARADSSQVATQLTFVTDYILTHESV